MSDFSETTYTSWGGALMDSIKGVLIGGICFLLSFALLFWNEGRAVTTQRSLDEGLGSIQSIAPDKVDPSTESKLVHMTGKATTAWTLKDPQFGLKANAIRLERVAEMYQWKEIVKEKKKRRKTTKTWEYKKVWSTEAIDSSRFDQQKFKGKGGTPNPPMKITSAQWQAKDVLLGAYTLSPDLTSQITATAKLRLDQKMAENLPGTYKSKLGRELKLHEGGLFWSRSAGTASRPNIGDQRIRWRVVKPQVVSIIAQQFIGSFRPYQTQAGDKLNMLVEGSRSADEMFTDAKKANTTLTWLLRLVGLLLMAFGLFMVGGPLVAVVDFLPFLGDLLSVGIALFAGLAAAALSLVTIAIAWIFYRPLLGVGLLVVAGGLIYGLKTMGSKARAG